MLSVMQTQEHKHSFFKERCCFPSITNSSTHDDTLLKKSSPMEGPELKILSDECWCDVKESWLWGNEAEKRAFMLKRDVIAEKWLELSVCKEWRFSVLFLGLDCWWRHVAGHLDGWWFEIYYRDINNRAKTCRYACAFSDFWDGHFLQGWEEQLHDETYEDHDYPELMRQW